MKTRIYYMDNDGRRAYLGISFAWRHQAEQWVQAHYYDYGTDLYIE